MASDPAARTQLFVDELGIEPWYFTVHGGTKFVYLNSMYGERVAALEGATLTLLIPDAHIEPMGLGTYLREMISGIPVVVRLDAVDSSHTELQALFTTGSFVGDGGDGADGAPAYIKPVDQGPCVASTFALDGPCFSSSPVTLEIDLGKVLGFPLPLGWRIRAELKDLTLSGVLTDSGAVQQGVALTILDFNLGARDIEAIIIQEYCAGKLEGCVPGDDGMPACPDAPGEEFFGQIPEQCDFRIVGIGLRIVFHIFESVTDLAVTLDANFGTYPAFESEAATPGGIAPDLFAPAPEGTCPADGDNP